MSVRIRYREVAAGIKESTKVLTHPSNGSRYRVRINTQNSQYYVLDDGTEVVAASGIWVDPARMKKEIRNALDKLGVKFDADVRSRKSVVQE